MARAGARRRGWVTASTCRRRPTGPMVSRRVPAAAAPEAQVARDTVTASLEDGVRHPAGEQPDDDHRDHLGAHVRTPNAGFFSVVATVIDSASQSRRTSSYLQTAPDRVRP